MGYTRNYIEKEEALIKDFLSWRVDGIIFVVGNNDGNKEIEKIVNRGFPFITIGRFKDLKTDFVSTDYFKGGYIAGEHLYRSGYRKLGFIFSYKDKKVDLAIEERKRGFLEFAKEKNLKVKEYYFEIKGSVLAEKLIEKGEKIGEKILKDKDRPDGIFTSNDEIGVGIVKSALKLGINIPKEIGIIGFDNSLSSILSPIPITTIRQNKEKVAEKAFKYIIRKIENGKTKVEEIVEPELVKRESTNKKEVDYEK